MKRIGYLLCALLLGSSVGLQAQSQSFETSKSIDIFHSILRELSLYYVDTLSVDKLVYTGIDAMLASLDPYTEFFPEEDTESIDMMTTGAYGGVGALIKKLPGQGVCISEPYENSPAAKASLVAGDVILTIDGESVLDWSPDQCSARMKGTPGTTVHFSVVKLRTKDTVAVDVLRERVHISDVALACMVQDTIAYLRVTAFTQDGSQEVRKALKDLKEQHDVKGIVLDLRGNGGGLMEEAVKMLAIFLPRNTMVVSARGRVERANMHYFTKEEPLDTTTPLVVLTDNGTASSSEIVAGAIQDLKRGLIVGQRTYGKGLVQAIRPLSYNTNLKITTAKYYIPSGRCVQAIDYSNRHSDGSLDEDANGGISPDIKAEAPAYSRIAMELAARDYLHDYSVQYYAQHPTIAPAQTFSLTDAEYEDFVTYVAALEFDDRSATEILLEQFKLAAVAEDYDEQLAAQLDTLQAQLRTDKTADLRHYKDQLKPLLEEEICCRYYFEKGAVQRMIRDDAQLGVALEQL